MGFSLSRREREREDGQINQRISPVGCPVLGKGDKREKGEKLVEGHITDFSGHWHCKQTYTKVKGRDIICKRIGIKFTL